MAAPTNKMHIHIGYLEAENGCLVCETQHSVRSFEVLNHLCDVKVIYSSLNATFHPCTRKRVSTLSFIWWRCWLVALLNCYKEEVSRFG